MTRVLMTADAHVRGSVYLSGETYDTIPDHVWLIVNEYQAGEALPDLEIEETVVVSANEGLGAEERDAVDEAAIAAEAVAPAEEPVADEPATETASSGETVVAPESETETAQA